MANDRNLGLAEKPKVEELQMDWLRSEDLKEEKNVTTPTIIIAVAAYCFPSLPKMSVIGMAMEEIPPSVAVSDSWKQQSQAVKSFSSRARSLMAGRCAF